MRKVTLHITVIFLCFLLLSPIYTPILAEASTIINIEIIRNVGSSELADIKFTVKNAAGQPKIGAKIELTPEGSPIPIYINYTNAYGIYVFEDMPPDVYAWQCEGQTGTVAIDAEENPLTITEKELFWMFFVLFASGDAGVEKGEKFFKTLAEILGYGPPPSKGSTNVETAVNYASWLLGLDAYLDRAYSDTSTFAAAKFAVNVGKFTINMISKIIDEEQIDSEINPSNKGAKFSKITFSVTRKGQQTQLGEFSSSEFFLGILTMIGASLDLYKTYIQLNINAVELNLRTGIDICCNIAKLAEGFCKFAKQIAIAAKKLALANRFAALAAGASTVVGALTIWAALMDYHARYGWTFSWDYLLDPYFWPIALEVAGGTCLVIAGLMMILGIETVSFSLPLLGTITISAEALGFIGGIILIIAFLLGYFLGLFNPPTVDPAKFAWYKQNVLSTVGPSINYLINLREKINTLNTTQLQQNSQQATAFAGYASEYANEAAGKYRTELLKARLYFTRVSQAYTAYKNAVEEARNTHYIDNLIEKYLSYTASNGKTITGKAVGINSTTATYNDTARTFTVNAAITPNGNQFTKKEVTIDNLDGTTTTIGYNDWQSWAGDIPVEHDNEGREFKVYYRTDTQKIHVIDDPDNYNQSPNWTVSNTTHFQYKYYFTCSPNEEVAWIEAINEWLNTIQTSEEMQKLHQFQDISNNLTSVITHPHPDKLPPPPTIIGPTYAYRFDTQGNVVMHRFAATTTNPDNHKIQYIFDWGDGARTITDWHNPGETAVVSHKCETSAPITYYQVKVSAIDENGAWSGWSTTHTTEIINNHPDLARYEWEWPQVPRDQTLAIAGYLPAVTIEVGSFLQVNYNPIFMDFGQGFDTYIMYEPLFGFDQASGQRINWLGESIKWLDPTTIEIKLRKKDIGGGKYAPYWVKITDWTAWEEYGISGVEYYRQINTTDVKYSFMLYDQYVGLNGFANCLENGWNSFITVDDKTIIIHLKPEYTYSNLAWQTLTSSYLIVPADVWQQINATYHPNLAEFINDWTDSTFRTARPNWLIASGMCLPIEHQRAEPPYYEQIPGYTLMKKNPLWWGEIIFKRMPAPNFILYISYQSLEMALKDLTNGRIFDWYGVAFDTPCMDDTTYLDFLINYPFLHTYLYNPPYYCEGDWYTYSTQYWMRWPHQDHPHLPCSPYGGSSQTA
ncbi:MAG: hypothetical protein QW270_02755, partial [Candidatus Bathyarchaeia archaeon]